MHSWTSSIMIWSFGLNLNEFWWEYFQLIIVSEAEGFNPHMIHCPPHTCNIDELENKSGNLVSFPFICSNITL
jgi:hypothetical protein